MTGRATEEYLLEIFTREHRIFVARVASTSYLMGLLEREESEPMAGILHRCLQSVFDEIRGHTQCFLDGYEALTLEERLGTAMGLGEDLLREQKRYFGSPTEAHQKLFVWPFVRIFFSERYSDAITREWSRVLPFSNRGKIWDQRLIKSLVAREADAETLSALEALDLYAACPPFVARVVPRLEELREEHREPLRFVTRRYNIGAGSPIRDDDPHLEGFDLSSLDLDDQAWD